MKTEEKYYITGINNSQTFDTYFWLGVIEIKMN